MTDHIDNGRRHNVDKNCHNSGSFLWVLSDSWWGLRSWWWILRNLAVLNMTKRFKMPNPFIFTWVHVPFAPGSEATEIPWMCTYRRLCHCYQLWNKENSSMGGTTVFVSLVGCNFFSCIVFQVIHWLLVWCLLWIHI